MFGCAALTTEYAKLANPAATKFAPPAPASITLPNACTLPFSVAGTPTMFTIGNKVVGVNPAPIFASAVILIAEVAIYYSLLLFYPNVTPF
jgi:hypothetical protein